MGSQGLQAIGTCTTVLQKVLNAVDTKHTSVVPASVNMFKSGVQGVNHGARDRFLLQANSVTHGWPPKLWTYSTLAFS